MKNGAFRLKASLAEMLVGGVIIDVANLEQAVLAEAVGASGVMVVDSLGFDVLMAGSVARMADPAMIKRIQDAVSIPVMAKCRVGHVVEAEILASLGVDYIDESEALTPINPWAHIHKSDFGVPFISGAQNLIEAMKRISEGASIVRCTARPGTGNVAFAVQQLREMAEEALSLQQYSAAELPTVATEMGASHALLLEVARRGRLPVVTFGAGGVATPADAALLRRFGADCVCVGSGVWHSSDPKRRAEAIVAATAHYDDIAVIREVSRDLGLAMAGMVSRPIRLEDEEPERGWAL